VAATTTTDDPRLLRARARAAYDARGWLAYNVPHAVPDPFAPFHEALVQLPPPGTMRALVLFRGAAKTTLVRGTVVHAAQHHLVRGVLWIRATDADARADREALVRLCQIAGIPHGTDGAQRMVNVAGVPVWTRSPGSAVRGLQHVTPTGAIIRPDLVIVDDMETRETARSAELTDRLLRWLEADVIPTAGQKHPVRVLMLGTPITPTSLIARAMRREGTFARWLPPLVVPIVNRHGVPAWPDAFDPTLHDRTPDDVWANEYLLEPLPAGSLVFPATRTVWVDMPTSGHAFIGADPAGEGRDRFGIVAAALYPSGLCVLDADAWDGPVENAPDRVAAMCYRLREAGLTVTAAGFEEGGDWRWAANETARLISPIPVYTEAPIGSKLERAMPLTVWHRRRRLMIAAHLRGSTFDVELHTWTRTGFTVTGHDDTIDAAVWACGLATHGWDTPAP
jgi:hypothetical protein